MRTSILLSLIFSVLFINAQESHLNTVYLEALGMGGLFSVNYERQFNSTSPVSAKVGLGFLPSLTSESVSIPYGVYYNFNHQKSWVIEAGIGSTLIFNYQDDPCGLFFIGQCDTERKKGTLHLFFASLGLKHYFGKEKKFVWKLNFNPIVGGIFKDERAITNPIPWMGVSIGSRF